MIILVLAKLHYYKGTIAVASTDSRTHKQFSDVVTGWNSVDGRNTKDKCVQMIQ